MKQSLVSVIIATFNSSSTLPKVLRSVRKQTYPSSLMEVLVIDGGSTDNTREIARSYGCRVIDNPKTLPLWAKHIGYTVARGDYALYLDSDEVIESNRSIERKIAVLKENPSVHAVTGSGYKDPEGYIFLNRYINEFGDPFSFFYYRLSKHDGYFIDTMRRRYTCIRETADHIVLDLSASRELPLFEFAAMGGVVDLAHLKAKIPEIKDNPSLLTHVVNGIVSKGSYIALTKHDALIHYSSDTYKKYLGKITSRVVNNIYTPAQEGFVGRESNASRSMRYKKYLFLPYAFSIVAPLLDAIGLCVSRKHIGYLIHVPLTFYTAIIITYYTVIKLLGIPVVIKSYGETMPVHI